MSFYCQVEGTATRQAKRATAWGPEQEEGPQKDNYTSYTRDQPVFFDSSVHCYAQALQLRSQYSTLSPPAPSIWIVLFLFVKKTLCIKHCKIINVYGLLINVHRVQCVFWRCGRWRLHSCNRCFVGRSLLPRDTPETLETPLKPFSAFLCTIFNVKTASNSD